MDKTLDRSNLGYLGADFEYKLIKCFIEEPKFFREAYRIIEQNVFTEAPLRRLVGYLKDYYKKYDTIPSYETLITIHNTTATDKLDAERFAGLIEQLKETTTEGAELVKENAIKFFRQQNIIKVSKKILEIAESGDISKYDDCQKLLDGAMAVGHEDEYGCSPYDLEEAALTPTYNCPIPTGIPELDSDLNGGLVKGKMGLIIGSAGFGKSTFSTSVASYAATYQCELNNFEGFKVLQIYFEDDDVDIARKHFSKLTGVEARKLAFENSSTGRIREMLDNYDKKDLLMKNLRLKRMPTGERSATDIKNFIKKIRNTGFSPDLVILDYFECLAPERGGHNTDSEWKREEILMRKLENMATELDIALWLPTQGNKGSFATSDVVTMDQAGGSIKKVQIAQVVLSIARSLADIDNNRAKMTVLKNRSGKSGRTYSLYFDNGTSTIKCDESMTTDGFLAFQEGQEADRISDNFSIVRGLRQTK